MSKSKIATLDSFARTRLSKTFFMRDFLFSETAATLGLSNLPTNKALAIQVGKELCQNVLEPIQDAWGRIHVRSTYRSEEVNQAGNTLGASCASNAANYAGHIWDVKDEQGNYGATACIVIPSYIDYYEQSGDWTSLAWWVHHHIPAYSSMYFFPQLCAFNINWYEDTQAPKNIKSYVKDPNTGHSKAILANNIESDFYSNVEKNKRFKKCTELLK
ncbi:MAG: hypothetical protein ACI9T7_000589 [Oleiphilaceae bacterium]|jgi:hypothetical protein